MQATTTTRKKTHTISGNEMDSDRFEIALKIFVGMPEIELIFVRFFNSVKMYICIETPNKGN